jgi:hypothetical protein
MPVPLGELEFARSQRGPSACSLSQRLMLAALGCLEHQFTAPVVLVSQSFPDDWLGPVPRPLLYGNHVGAGPHCRTSRLSERKSPRDILWL